MSSTSQLLQDPSQTFPQLCESLGMDGRVWKALARLGHVRPTLVQSHVLPLAIREGRNLLVKAKTGSGKTLAYSLPLLHKILNASESTLSASNTTSVQAVILVPTKELCAQVTTVLETLTYYCADLIKLATLTTSAMQNSKPHQVAQQDAQLRDHPQIVVATPSSLVYFLNRHKDKILNLSQVHTLVVDEADVVLSFGHQDDLTQLMQKVPTTCQSFLVSATLSPELENFRQVVLHNPALVQLEEEENKTKGTPKLIQFYLPLPKKDKNLVLYVFLKLGLLRGKGLMFVNSVDAGYRLKLFLQQFHIHSAVWNAELPLSSRMHTMEQFNVGNIDYLILTDEARGMDFYRVSFVVNVELPETPTDYIHRVGRTARAGAKGVALTLIDRDSQAEWDALTHIQASQPRLPTTTTQGGLLQPFRQQEDETTEEDASSLIQPSPLDFDLQEVEGFRYRVEDVQRAVTKVAVQEARAQELKAEILNSERLSHHFAEHPADLQLLQHDRMTNQHQPLQHLSHVPKYLLPRGMQVADLHKRRRKKRVRLGGGERRTDNDPLQAFDAPETVDDMMLEDDKKQVAAKPATEADRKIYANAQDGTGKSTSGRKAWQAKHKVGKFSNKRRKNEPKRRRVGI